MKIAILGAGTVGAPLARAFGRGGHDVVIANSRGAETIQDLAASLGVVAADAADALEGANVVITSIPLHSYRLIRTLIADLPPDIPVIDTGNYHPVRDGQIAAIDEGQIEASWISEQLGRPVTKAWNTVLSSAIAEGGRPAGSPERFAITVAGDDSDARRLACELTDVSGFDALDIGGLDESWRTQPGTSAYCTELPLAELPAAVDRADRLHAPVRRDASNTIFRTFGNPPPRDHIVRVYRAITQTPDPA
ncbi:MAG: NAD(P)-binding domain-containing protein [Mycetocola sp.]